MVDTIAVNTPALNPQDLASFFEGSKRVFTLQSGVLSVRGVTHSLEGSYDSRVSVMLMESYYAVLGDSKRPVQIPCPPYLRIEFSAPKWVRGSNGHVTEDDLMWPVWSVIDEIWRSVIGRVMPQDEISFFVENCALIRLDVGQNFRYRKTGACFVALKSLENAIYPRRNSTGVWQGKSIMWPGSADTLKCYHKGLEQKLEANRLQAAFAKLYPNENPRQVTQRYLESLSNVLRWEMTIRADRIRSLYNWDIRLPKSHPHIAYKAHKSYLASDESWRVLPEPQLVSGPPLSKVEITPAFTHYKAQREMVIREVTPMSGTIAYRYDDVSKRLVSLGKLHLLGSWVALSQKSRVGELLPSSTYYRHRKELVSLGCSWLASDISPSIGVDGLSAISDCDEITPLTAWAA